MRDFCWAALVRLRIICFEGQHQNAAEAMRDFCWGRGQNGFCSRTPYHLRVSIPYRSSASFLFGWAPLRWGGVKTVFNSSCTSSHSRGVNTVQLQCVVTDRQASFLLGRRRNGVEVGAPSHSRQCQCGVRVVAWGIRAKRKDNSGKYCLKGQLHWPFDSVLFINLVIINSQDLHHFFRRASSKR